MKGITIQGPPALPSKDTPTKDITLGWSKCCIFKISSTRFCTSLALVKIPEGYEEEEEGGKGEGRGTGKLRQGNRKGREEGEEEEEGRDGAECVLYSGFVAPCLHPM